VTGVINWVVCCRYSQFGTWWPLSCAFRT